MEAKNIKFYLYGDHAASTAVEESTFMRCLEEAAASANREKYTGDEISAAIALMIMHYQVKDAEPEIIAPVQQQVEREAEDNPDISEQSQNRKNNCWIFSFLSACCNSLIKFLTRKKKN